MSAHAHPAASVYANVYADVHNTCLTYTLAHAWRSKHLSECMPQSTQKMHMYPCMRACATVQKLLCNGSYCELILSLARASCRLSLPLALAARLAVSTKLVACRCSLKKSVQIVRSFSSHPSPFFCTYNDDDDCFYYYKK